MAYININDVKDKSIMNAINQSNWSDEDIQRRIDEGEAIIDAYLIKAGYKKTDLINCALVKKINVLLAKYNILRDLYSNISPSKVEEKGFVRWREEALELLNKIKNYDISLVDNNGNEIKFDAKKMAPVTNTSNTKRIFKISDEYNWSKPDNSYYDDDVIGEK